MISSTSSGDTPGTARHVAETPVVLPHSVAHGVAEARVRMVARMINSVSQWRALLGADGSDSVADGAVGVKHRFAGAGHFGKCRRRARQPRRLSVARQWAAQARRPHRILLSAAKRSSRRQRRQRVWPSLYLLRPLGRFMLAASWVRRSPARRRMHAWHILMRLVADW